MRRVAEQGLYYITTEDNETLDNGTNVLHTDTIAIMADNRTVLDTKLKAKWGGMKAGFASQNIDQSLKYVSFLSNVEYRLIFIEIADQLPSIAAGMQDIELIYVEDKHCQI